MGATVRRGDPRSRSIACAVKTKERERRTYAVFMSMPSKFTQSFWYAPLHFRQHIRRKSKSWIRCIAQLGVAAPGNHPVDRLRGFVADRRMLEQTARPQAAIFLYTTRRRRDAVANVACGDRVIRATRRLMGARKHIADAVPPTIFTQNLHASLYRFADSVADGPAMPNIDVDRRRASCWNAAVTET